MFYIYIYICVYIYIYIRKKVYWNKESQKRSVHDILLV